MTVLYYFHQGRAIGAVDRKQTEVIYYEQVLSFYLGYFFQIGSVSLTHLKP